MGNFIEDIIEADLATGRVKNVAVRFPPEPNGYLHIGHAKAICLNLGLAKKYGGVCNLRFDDTNPAKEEEEYVNSIIEDVKWLGNIDKILYASDYFKVMYDSAVKLIDKGLAYVDDITPEQMRETRGTLKSSGTNSKNRNRPKEENLKLFKDMKNGLVQDGALVLRAKIDMASPNINMRDPIIYRVVNMPHHRTGNQWHIYPMYDFAHPIEDAVEKITHSCCTLEFEDHRPLYDWVVKNCEFNPPPHQYEFARLNIARTIMSKRYLKKLVDNGEVEGWDDPRMPTLAGLRRRGYTAASIREFCSRIGVAKANSEVAADQLESCIREELNTSAERAMAVLEPIELVITNRPDNFIEKLNFEYTVDGMEKTREITFTNRIYIEREDFMENPPPKFYRLFVGGIVRLKSAHIVSCTGFDKDKDGRVVRVYASIIEGTKSGDAQSTVKAKGTIHWVDANNCVPLTARLYDYLLIDGNADADFSERLNPESLILKTAYGEPFLKTAQKGTAFQFLRLAYFVRDSKSEELVFNRIVGLKDTQKAKI